MGNGGHYIMSSAKVTYKRVCLCNTFVSNLSREFTSPPQDILRKEIPYLEMYILTQTEQNNALQRDEGISHFISRWPSNIYIFSLSGMRIAFEKFPFFFV